MTIDTLLESIRQSPLAEHAQTLVARARAAVAVDPVPGVAPLGGSRFGGLPDLPAGVAWPTVPGGHYRFVAQFDCSAIPAGSAPLPTSGLLSVFVVHDTEGTFFWRDPGFVRVLYTSAGEPLEPLSAPPGVDVSPASAVRLTTTMDLPADRHQAPDLPWGRERRDLDRAYRALRSSLHTGPDHLLGYPSHTSLEYDPTPGPDWVPLLTLGSDDDRDWCWHDGDFLMVFIERARLAEADFSVVAADAG